MSILGPRRDYAPVDDPRLERTDSDLEAGSLPHGSVPNDVGVRNGNKLTYDLGGFFDQQQLITDDLHRMKGAMSRLERMNEESKVVTLATVVESLSQRQKQEVDAMSATVDAIHNRLTALVKDNLDSSTRLGSGKGSSTFQTRQNVTGAVLNKLEKRRKEIDDFAERIVSDGREIIRRRYRSLLGSLPDEPIVDKLSRGSDRDRVLKKLSGNGRHLDHLDHLDLTAFGEELAEREVLVYGLQEQLGKQQQKFLDMSILLLEGGMAPDSIGEGLLESRRGMKQQLLGGGKGGGVGRFWGGRKSKLVMLMLLFLFLTLTIIVIVLILTTKQKGQQRQTKQH